jgi:DNA-binding protein HU-beta
MHKNEFIKQLAKETNLPQKDVNQILKSFMDIVGRTLKDGDKVVLTGFGTFEMRTRSERPGVNPQTKERIIIPPTQTPGFTASNTLKATVLGREDGAGKRAKGSNSKEKEPPKKRGRKPAKTQ